MRRRVAPGSPPGTLFADAAAPAPRVHVLGYDEHAFEEADVAGLDGLRPWLARSGVLWIDVVGLGDVPLLTGLADLVGLHRLVLEDVVHVHQRPKVEDYGDSLFIVTRMPRGEGGDTEQVSLFLRRGLLVSFQEHPGDVFEAVRGRLRGSKGRIRAEGADYLAYALVDAITDALFPVLEAFGERLDRLEARVLDVRPRPVITDLHGIKRELLQVRRVLWPMRDMLSALMREGTPVIQPETRVYLRDSYDHAVQLMDILELDRETASSLTEVHFSAVSNRLGDVMRVLTIIATIFIPLTFLAGVWGMNFASDASPWNMPELQWEYGYPFALVLMLSVAGAMLLWFRRLGWLRRARPVREADGSG